MFKETKTIIHTNKINEDIKLLIFSDVHYISIKDKKRLEKLYDKIKKYDIDYICIIGDLIDKNEIKDKKYFIGWITKLSEIKPLIISLGNHDLKIKKSKSNNLWNIIKNIKNVYLLDNRGLKLNELYFYGFTQSSKYYSKNKKEDYKIMLQEINKNKILNIPKNCFNILLMHSPICLKENKVENKLKKYDLILCGHMHNGIVPPIFDELIKNNIGLVAPNKSLFPKNARGIIKKDNIIIISSGINKLSRSVNFFIRIFNFIFPLGINYVILSNNKEYKTSIKYYL